MANLTEAAQFDLIEPKPLQSHLNLRFPGQRAVSLRHITSHLDWLGEQCFRL